MSETYPNTISWFEVPVTDMGRAMNFYQNVLDMKMETMEMEGCKMAIFPHSGDNRTAVHGALVEGEGYTPASGGPILYFYGGEDLNTALNKVEAAGGKVTKPKFSIGDHGFCAFFTDTEGNNLAFHSNN